MGPMSTNYLSIFLTGIMIKSKNKTLVTLLFIASLTLVHTSTLASPPSNHPCAINTKDKKSVAKEQCENYILGFLEGALLTDAAIIEGLERETSGFLQKVFRTRTVREKEPLPPTYFAKFCLPDRFNKMQIAREIVNYLATYQVESVDHDQRVYNAFKKRYPCG